MQTLFQSPVPNGERARITPRDRRLVAQAVEPTGVGPYVEAVQELIEQIVPQPAPALRARLRIVR